MLVIVDGNKKRWHTINISMSNIEKPLYGLWRNMLNRCNNPNATHYADYGGRGIKVCERWRDYNLFAADVGERPTIRHQLNRIDNDGDYTPENTEWTLPMRNLAYNARRVRADNKVGVPGVYYHKRKKRYHATITVHTRRIHLGWFVSRDMAIKVRRSAEEKFLGMIE